MTDSKAKKSKPAGFGNNEEIEELVQEQSVTETPVEPDVVEVVAEEPAVKRHHKLVRPMSRRKEVPVKGKKSATIFRI